MTAVPTPSRRGLLLGTFDPDHTRNRVVRAVLERAGWTLVEVRRDLWGSERYAQVREGRLRTMVRAVAAYTALVARSLTGERPDLVVVGYPGHVDMLVLAPIWRLRGVPVLFDPLLSLEDTVVADRAMLRSGSPGARALALLDRAAFRLATRIAVDTPEVGAFYAERFGVPAEKLVVIWPGTDEEALGPRVPAPTTTPQRVLFHGSYIPLHGIETIVHAADRLRDQPIEFRIIGDGQLRPAVERLVADLGGLPNLTLVGRMPLAGIGDEIRAASICLGIFGTSAKASRVVPFKVFEYCALGRPIITGDTPAVRSALGDAAVRVPVGDPDALARAIRELHDDADRRERLGHEAARRFDTRFSLDAQARAVAAALAPNAPAAAA